MTVKEIQPLVALFADAFSKHNVGDVSGDNDNKGSSFLKEIQRVMKEPSFKRMNINTKNPLFKNPEKCVILKDSIDIESLDIHFLLKLMKETSFLKLEQQQGKCTLHHGETCCQYCDHGQEGEKCKQCDTTKVDCGKICCLSCNKCLRCHRDNLKHGIEEYLKGNIKMDELKQHSNACWMFPLKKSLEILLKCENLVHESIKKIESAGGSIGEFQNTSSEHFDHLCKEIYFAAIVLTLVLSKTKFFDRDVGEEGKRNRKEN